MSENEKDFRRVHVDDLHKLDKQARGDLDAATVAEYAEIYRAGGEEALPPLVVFGIGQIFGLNVKVHGIVGDGYHRLEALLLAGLSIPTVEWHECASVEEAERAAAWFAAGSNVDHGLRRSNADKRAAVALALRHSPGLSDRAIAEHCRVSHPLVAEVRKELFPAPPEVAGDVEEFPSGGESVFKGGTTEDTEESEEEDLEEGGNLQPSKPSNLEQPEGFLWEGGVPVNPDRHSLRFPEGSGIEAVVLLAREEGDGPQWWFRAEITDEFGEENRKGWRDSEEQALADGLAALKELCAKAGEEVVAFLASVSVKRIGGMLSLEQPKAPEAPRGPVERPKGMDAAQALADLLPRMRGHLSTFGRALESMRPDELPEAVREKHGKLCRANAKLKKQAEELNGLLA
jgi:hypothetical protein